MTQLDVPNRQTTPTQHTRVLGSSFRCLDKEGKRPQNTDALYTSSPGALYGRLHGPVAHIGRMSLCSVQHAPSTHYEPQCGLGADCPARWLATIKSRRRRASQLLLRLQRRAHGSLKTGRNVEMTGCTSEAATQYHQGCISSAPRSNNCHPPLGMPAASSHAVHFGGLQRSSRDF
eukprot:scaffold1448_cov79-Phaeocystis_antarctica.AAC.1